MNPLLFVDIFERKILRRKTFASLIRKYHLTVITVQVNTYGNNKINLKRKPARSNGDITHMKYTNENYIFVPDISNDKTISRQDFFQLSQVKKWISSTSAQYSTLLILVHYVFSCRSILFNYIIKLKYKI